MDAGEILTTFAPLPAPLKKVLGEGVDAATTAGKVGKGAFRIGAGAAQEGLEEGWQNWAQTTSLGDKFDINSPESRESIALGALMGGAFGGSGVVKEGYSDRKTNQAIQQINNQYAQMLEQAKAMP